MALVEKKFHSKELLPAAYREKPEDIESFETHVRKGYHFGEGEEVIHIHNHDQLMVVGAILRKKDDKDSEKFRIDGILCHWWEKS